MANVFTALHKRPRTVHNQTYVQWNDEIAKWRQPEPSFYTPHVPLLPPPPFKRFRPIPPEKDQPDDRIKTHDRRGLNTPEQSFHIGYKHFHIDPFTKKLRQLDAEKPLPYTLNTEFRSSFRNPNIFPTLNFKHNTGRYSLPVDKRPAIGIVPRLLSIPHQYLTDDPSWMRDCNTT